jgi:hypothetical protein
MRRRGAAAPRRAAALPRRSGRQAVPRRRVWPSGRATPSGGGRAIL